MDPKEVFERRSARGQNPAEPGQQEPKTSDTVPGSAYEGGMLPIAEPGPRMIEFQRKTEDWFAFSYFCLMNLQYRPHDRLVFTFSTHEVVVLGRNLKQLYDEVMSQSCEKIAETDRASAFAGGEVGFEVLQISIERLGEVRTAWRDDEGTEPVSP